MGLQDILGLLNERQVALDLDGDELVASAPPGALGPELVQLLKSHKAALLEVLRHGITPALLPLVTLTQDEIDRIVATVPQGVANVQDIYPLAPLQEGILFHHLLEPEGDAYLSRSLLAFAARPLLDNFLGALQRVIDRHDTLRSAVLWEGLPLPVQVVCREAALPIHEVAFDTGGNAVAQLQALTDPRHLRLDLHRAPLLAAYIAHDPESGEWLLALLAHHLMCDHVSLELILAEIQLLLQGRGDPLPAPLPYRNFIAETCSESRDAAENRHQAHFRAQLADIDAPTAPFGVFTVRPGDAVDESRLMLNDRLADRLRQVARQQGVTAAVLFHAAWALVLAQCCDQDDVVFGTVLLGRMRSSAGANRAVGMFINTLPLRVSLGGRSVWQVVLETHQQLTELLVHEQASLALAQRCSSVPAPLPLFTTLLNYRHSPRGHGRHGGNSATADDAQVWQGVRVLAGEERSNYPLSIDVDDTGQDFGITVQGAPGLDAARIAAYLQTAVEGLAGALARDPALPIAALSVLPAAERRCLLDDWNRTAVVFPGPPLLHRLFEAQAAARPDATALVSEAGVLSYGELNRRANQIAHRLLALGLQPDDRVALGLPRSLEAIAAMLGVLKAGGAYVPLDPAAPPERLAFLLRDCAPVAVLALAAMLGRLPESPAQAIAVDAGLDGQATHNPDAPDLTPRHLAYVIYTSGSTGQPKGVMVEHGSLANLVQAHVGYCELTPADRVLQFAALGFDSSVAEIFPALAAGATLVLRPDDLAAPDGDFDHFLRDQRITVADLPAAFWHPWCNRLGAGRTFGREGENVLERGPLREDLRHVAGLHNENRRLDAATPAYAHLRLVIASGEKAELHALRTWFATPATRHCRWLNNYGPTEATVNATMVALDQHSPLPARDIPIGRPIANVRVYLLDRQQRPVPLGAVGELCIGGAGVARGYLNRPDLTGERFLPDPFAGTPGARLYRTGDLARYRPDGQLEYLGRNDFQLKIRGYRIEPGEIEARLRACAGVREALVVARDAAPGTDPQLVAYLLAEPGTTLAPDVLRRALAAVLPDYQLPGAFVVLDAFPLTPNGKIDRRALPAPGACRTFGREGENALKRGQLREDLRHVAGLHNESRNANGPFAAHLQPAHRKSDRLLEAALQPADRPALAPVGPLETALATLWQTLLGLRTVSRDDNFFAIGGHSLLAVQLLARLRQAFGVDLTLRDLFAHPRLQDLAEAVARAHGAMPGAAVPPIPHADRSRPLPLSWAQQRLWFLAQLDPAAGAAYQLPGALRLSGPLDRAALQAALDRVVARHEVLRTCFVKAADDTDPVQRIAPPDTPFPLACHDLRGLPEAERDAAVPRHGDAMAGEPFDLAQGPLIRGALLQLADDDHVLFFNQHHIVTDGWSIGLLVNEVAALYTAFSRHAPDPLPPLPLQYADYAAWQRQWLQGPALQVQLDFWRRHLSGAPPLLALPTDAPRPAVQTYAGGSFTFILPPELTAGLKALSQRHGATLFMTLLASWATLLARLSSQQDVVVGTPVANRPRAELESLIGFFVNTLALRIRPESGLSVAALLQQVQTTTLDAYAHQDVPFEQVVEALQPARTLAYSPVFQVMLTLDNTPPVTARPLPGLQLAPLAASTSSTRYDLSLALTETPEGLAGNLAYATALFAPATIERWLGHWRTLLTAMVADASQPLHALPLLSESERRRLLVDFNDTAAEYPRDRCVHELFEYQAQQAPEAVALVGGGQSLSYGELNRRANRLAHQLLALGVRPDDRIAVLAERSPGQVIALLATLKAGAAYVPLDPHYPAERLAFMLADSAPKLVLRQAATALDTGGVPMLDLDSPDTGSGQPATNPDRRRTGLRPGHLAYVIYTSGSTGRPKGVMVEHGALVNLLLWKQRAFGFTAADRVLQKTSFSFDGAVWEFWSPLSCGARLVLAPLGLEQDVAGLLATIRREGITALKLVPALLNLVCQEAEPGSCPTLRHVFAAGEALPAPTAARFAAAFPQARLHNLYGPTECTVDATAWTLPAGEIPVVIPLGRPIANVRVYVLDERRQPVPLGVAGEIHVGGVGVARGYLNRPELTAERFIPDPFHTGDGSRLYRTGDLGRWRPDGTLEFLGRNDGQVKVRGFRIEPGEIEARLAAHPAVQASTVAAREDRPGAPRLVAYLVPRPDQAIDFAALRTYLQATLPDYLLPAAYVTLDALPLSPNGKVDRNLLPAPEADLQPSRSFEPPAGAIETAIAGLWQQLLGVARVGRHDDFFALGGHSILAVQFTSRLRRQLGVELALRELFAAPTPAGLAERVAAALGGQQQRLLHPNLCPIRPNGPDRPLFLVHAAGGEVAYARDLAPHLPTGLPAYGLAASGVLPDETPLRTVEAMAARYVEAIRQVQPQGPYRLGGYSSGGIVAWEIANQLIGADQTVEFLGLIDTSYTDGFAAAPPPDEATFLLDWCRGQQQKSSNPALIEELEPLAAAGDLDAMQALAQAAGVIPSDIDGAALRRYLAVFLASDEALSRYAPPPLPAPVSLFVSDEHPEHPEHPRRPAEPPPADENAPPEPWNAWRKLAGERLTLIPIGGDHETIVQPPQLQRLAAAVASRLDQAAAQAILYPEHRYAPLVTVATGHPGVNPLFCVPGAGASVTAFCALAEAVGSAQPVHGLQPRGLDDALVPHSDVPSAARCYLQAVRAVRPHGPYQLLGHSFGGAVVFEMARQLKAAGESVGLLVVVDSEAPLPPDAVPPRDTRVGMLQKLVELYEMGGQSLDLTAEDFSPLRRDEQLALLLQRLVAARLMPPRTPLQVLRNLVRVFDTNLNTRYVPAGSYDGPLHLVEVATPPASAGATADARDLLAGWRRWAPGATRWRAPGNHLTVLAHPQVDRLAAWLQPLLTHVQRS